MTRHGLLIADPDHSGRVAGRRSGAPGVSASDSGAPLRSAPATRTRVRFTVRRLMVAVAIIALILWSMRMYQLSREYRIRAEDYRSHGHNAAVIYYRTNRSWGYRLRDHYWRLSEKYDRAARYPWLRVAPDPPEP